MYTRNRLSIALKMNIGFIIAFLLALSSIWLVVEYYGYLQSMVGTL